MICFLENFEPGDKSHASVSMQNQVEHFTLSLIAQRFIFNNVSAA